MQPHTSAESQGWRVMGLSQSPWSIACMLTWHPGQAVWSPFCWDDFFECRAPKITSLHWPWAFQLGQCGVESCVDGVFCWSEWGFKMSRDQPVSALLQQGWGPQVWSHLGCWWLVLFCNRWGWGLKAYGDSGTWQRKVKDVAKYLSQQVGTVSDYLTMEPRLERLLSWCWPHTASSWYHLL